MAAMDAIINVWLMADDYKATANLWRAPEEMKIWIFYVVDFFVALFFTIIFSKGYEGKGVLEGARYGLYVGCMMAIPMAYGTYGSMPIPYSLAFKWFIFGLADYVICGAILAGVFGKKATVTPVSSGS